MLVTIKVSKKGEALKRDIHDHKKEMPQAMPSKTFVSMSLLGPMVGAEQNHASAAETCSQSLLLSEASPNEWHFL